MQTRKKTVSNHGQRKVEKAEEIDVRVEVIDESLLGRPVRDSQSEMAELVLPNDANPLGALLGGRLMHWIDLAGAMAVHRHARSYAVTASVDHIDFLVPVRVGDLVILRSSVNRVFHTSAEVGVKVFVENYIADTAQHVASAYLTFVAIDREGNRLTVTPVIPETDEQRRRYDDAGRRRESRRSEVERRRKTKK
ncbi:MAG: acyl-CoA thioesterase [Candidatus Sulfotelmatobacter sp.]